MKWDSWICFIRETDLAGKSFEWDLNARAGLLKKIKDLLDACIYARIYIGKHKSLGRLPGG